ncbi:MAG: two-component sensor histidine kinase [Desulfosarcina sp.]|nr:two-component sensor histidine kinase [Desulfosarcina sp.]MBC2744083.1 two-component sensor histidine kinase [Desulfosarcina sp.]MBC2766992.1 two-component sensor histidine kinase [Desulfosarcina sp.]
MAAQSKTNGNTSGNHSDAYGKKNYSPLFWRFITLTVVCSLLPLLLVGWGINIHYTRFSEARVIDSLKNQLEHHDKIIELFINRRSYALKVIAKTHSMDELIGPNKLDEVFEVLNHEDGSFTDLGVIGENGDHLAYAGPFSLKDKNYSNAFWFKKVLENGIFISDMFMGFRQEPHFIIAVVRMERGKRWILRGTVDTEVFRSLVESTMVGKTGEVLLVNPDGIFQTSPRFSGKIMEKAPFAIEKPQKKIKVDILKDALSAKTRQIPRQIAVWTWLKEPKWMLMIRQDYDEALNAVKHANFVTLVGLHLSALIILVVTMLITRHMIVVIRQRDEEADQLNRQYLQASKLASIGQLSAGVAHEINNPLAIILTERQILMDMEGQAPPMDPDLKAQFHDSMEQIDIQIQRCKRITQNLLRFARRTQSLIEPVDLNAFIKEVVELMEREARTSGIKFFTDLEENLPEIQSDPSQLQQVFLNMITNAVDAHDGMPYGTISITTGSENSGKNVRIGFADTGSGIRPEHLEKLFDPFFTTKPVGKGTGLGLSICFSIIERLGGEIKVRSNPGEGSEFIISLPLEPPSGLKEELAQG